MPEWRDPYGHSPAASPLPQRIDPSRTTTEKIKSGTIRPARVNPASGVTGFEPRPFFR
jgi:hypothetical protein